MSTFVINYKNNIIGIYDDLSLAMDYIFSCLNSKLININDNIKISCYKINSCIVLKEITVDLYCNVTEKVNYNYFLKTTLNDIESDSSVHSSLSLLSLKKDDNDSDSESSVSTDSSSSSESPSEFLRRKEQEKELRRIEQEKCDLVHNINMLKVEQEKLKNEMNIYETDLELFNRFKTEVEKDKNFKIPFLFEKKFIVFKNLEEKNKLSFENFKLIYVEDEISTEYSDLFADKNVSINELNEFI